MSDHDLLQMRFCDLPIALRGTKVERRAHRVFAELKSHRLRLKPQIWLSEEWFNPDGVAGFAIPFYLAHPRLVRLERAQMLEAEGNSEGECLRILRHETGHVVDEAYQLFRSPEYARLFGDPNVQYPVDYKVDPGSKNFVMHLNAWYAQAHPVEDFAETFAVWLGSNTSWRRRYRGWPALAKLEVVNRWMGHWAGRRPLVSSKRLEHPLASIQRTLAEHYREKRAMYAIGAASDLDGRLTRIFGGPGTGRRSRSAARFLQLLRRRIRHRIARPLGVPAYTVDQVLRQLIARSAALDLRLEGDVEAVARDVVRLADEATVQVIEKGRRMPL